LLTIAAGGAFAPAGIPAADARVYPGHDPIFAAIEAHRKLAAVEQAAWDEVNRLTELADKKVGPPARNDARQITDERALTDGPNAAASDALDEFAETVPTTLPGLLAMIVYASEANERNSGGVRPLPGIDGDRGASSDKRGGFMKTGLAPAPEIHDLILAAIDAHRRVSIARTGF
jgi:hypothetical protein